MGIFETYAKRKRKIEKTGQHDVYQYNSLPLAFKNQVIHIWNDAIGPFWEPGLYSYTSKPTSNEIWQDIHDVIAREVGIFNLGHKGNDPYIQCQEYLHNAETDDALSLIEVSFRVIEKVIPEYNSYYMYGGKIKLPAKEAIDELNQRFLEHNIGYQYQNSEIIRIDSQYIHTEVVKPALSLLGEVAFKGALEEFLCAHRNYRKGDYKQAIGEALKAFESTMKSICDARSWIYPKNATAKPLLNLIFDNGLIPRELLSHYTALQSTLESGVPTLSNIKGRHGQGLELIEVPSYLAAYVIHLTASNIVMLIEAHKHTK